jgi:drug/metabolite transporter (DMT)-like permease
VSELAGVVAAMLSSALGGSSVAATRYLAATVDPLTIGAFRFGGGVLLLLPVALLQGSRWPARRDWPAVGALGLLFFGVFPVLFNASLAYTTAARGALALSTLPLLTMVAGALVGVEPLTGRKATGVFLAMAGVAIALLTGLSKAPADAWQGDLLMIGAALCMALYNVWSRPFIRRSDPIAFTAMGMAVGATLLVFIAGVRDGFSIVAVFRSAHWLAVGFLALFGSALTFFLWAFALQRTTPTRVAISVTVNPISASIIGAALLGEPLRWNLVVGLLTVFLGIWTATTTRHGAEGRGQGHASRRTTPS